jgi:hypothetical protein
MFVANPGNILLPIFPPQGNNFIGNILSPGYGLLAITY